MNLKRIKERFIIFLKQFNENEIDLVMLYLEMVVDDYNNDAKRLLGTSFK
jgi:hypothetical protein